MAPPLSFASLTWNDNTVKPNGSPESGSVGFAITTLTPANVAAQATLVGNLATAINAIVLGVFARSEITYERTALVKTPASSQNAQRETKLLLRYHGNTSQKSFRIELPTFDLTELVSGSEFLVLTSGNGAALKTAFEAVVKSPDDPAESVTLDTAQHVGRNS